MPEDPFRLTEPGPAPAQPFDLPPIRSTTLTSGVRAFTVERHTLPVVALRVVVGRGAVGAPPGVASLAAAALLEGTKWSSGLAIHQRFAEMGALVSTAASYDAIAIDVKVPTPNLRSALEVVDDILRAPAFPVDETERVKARLLADMALRASRPQGVAASQLAALLYPPGHPYRESVEGSEEAIRAVGRVDLERFWRAAAVPPLTAFIVAGDIDDGTTLGMLRKLFDGWSGAAPPAAPALPPVATTGAAKLVLVDRSNDRQCVVSIGWLVADRDSDDVPALRALAATLAQGTSGRLDRLLRGERGETYDVQATLTPGVGASEFVITASLERERTADALRESLGEIERLRTQSLPASDEPGARAVLRSVMWHSFETSDDVVSALTDSVVHRDPVDRLRARLLAPTAVRFDQVQRVASKYLTSESRHIVIVGDASRVRPSLEALGLGEIVVR
jgi:zinc protease